MWELWWPAMTTVIDQTMWDKVSGDGTETVMILAKPSVGKELRLLCSKQSRIFPIYVNA